MSFVSRDFKPRRSPPPSGPRKIPVLRVVLLLGIAFLVWKNRDAFKSPSRNPFLQVRATVALWFAKDSSEVPQSLSRKEQLALAGGKIFRLQNGCIQESWRIQNSKRLHAVQDIYADARMVSLMRTLTKADHKPFLSGILDLVFKDTATGRLPLLARFQDSSKVATIIRMPLNPVGADYRYFDAKTSCVWLEPCPVDPLAGGAVPIGDDFDFGGREHLLTHDLFRGIGESPVVAVLPGVVRRIQVDSTQGTLVEIQHANNQMSRSFGLAGIAEGLKTGLHVAQGDPIGRLSARDTVELVFQFLRNGQFVRWDDFRKESRPVSDSVIATFQENLLR